MHHSQQMLQTHPRSGQSMLNLDALSDCLNACFSCAETCTICADACLNESDPKMLTRCIRLNLDCADVCATTGRMLARLAGPDPVLLRHMVQTCAEACRACGAECEQHAHHHEHCRLCAEECRRCEQACSALLAAETR